MSEIISLSVDDATAERLKEIQKIGDFNGRSELLRTAVYELYDSLSELDDVDGPINAVIVVTHPHTAEEALAEMAHTHDKLIDTHIHSKLDAERCLEVFQVSGDGESVIEFYRKVQGSKKTTTTDIMIP